MSMEFPSSSPKAGDRPHVVIPYSYGDHEFSRKLAGALRRDGVTSWIDEVDMSAGAFLISRITHAVRPVDFVVPVISAASATSSWLQHELKTAMTREFNARRIKVLPARVDDSVLPDYLKSELSVDFHGRRWNQAYEDLKAILQRRTYAGQAMRPRSIVMPPSPGLRAPDVKRTPRQTKRIFLSYDYDNDGRYKDIMDAWSQSPDFAQFSGHDQPVTVPVDSEAAEPIKRAIAAKIGAATAFLCIVGEKTCANPWVEWEIRKADELGKRMIGVRVSRDHKVSETLYNAGATWALSFTFEGIKSAMEEAHGT
ncbi:MAG: toll/interleukin-1 receptor domain-containing protein [candidate division WOR-3 bacterium]|nr:toll/interleukin-1 receptor domain-containing protein [candidate division WOR-3 bacterium]